MSKIAWFLFMMSDFVIPKPWRLYKSDQMQSAAQVG